MLAGGASSLTRISLAAVRKKCEVEGGAPVTRERRIVADPNLPGGGEEEMRGGGGRTRDTR
jgi:hypothetical protein